MDEGGSTQLHHKFPPFTLAMKAQDSQCWDLHSLEHCFSCLCFLMPKQLWGQEGSPAEEGCKDTKDTVYFQLPCAAVVAFSSQHKREMRHRVCQWL